MKTIDLGEKPETSMAQPTRGKKAKYYPTVYYSDEGVAGVSSFDEKDIGKVITVKAEIKLTRISSNSNEKDKKKKYDYTFEVHKISMPDDLSKQEDSIKARREKKARKQGFE